MVFNEKTVSSELIHKGKIIDLRIDTVALPEGRTAIREIVDHPGGVAIVPLTEDGKIVMVKQFRKPVEKAIYEIPAGKIDEGEEHRICGIRELKEETGYTASEFVYLGFMYPSPGFANELTHIYLANGLTPGETHFDRDEYLDILEIESEKVIDMIMNNEINDAKTVFGIFKAMEYLKRQA